MLTKCHMISTLVVNRVSCFFSFVLVVYGGLLVHMCGEKFGSGFMRLLAGWIFLSTSYPHCGQRLVWMFLSGGADWFLGIFIFGFKNPIVYITGPVF